MKLKTFERIIAMIIITLISVSNVLGLGIAPAKKIIAFEPGASKTYSYIIVNNENKDMDLAISASGDLADFISIPKETVHLEADEQQKTFDITLVIPKEIEPGQKTTKIKVSERNPDSEKGERSVNVMLEVNSVISMDVPYPEDYVAKEKPGFGDSDMTILNYSKYFVKGKMNKFEVEVKNNQDKNISNVFAVISIEGLPDKIKSLGSDFAPYETKKIVSYFDTANLPLGKYNSNISIFYLAKSTSLLGEIQIIEESKSDNVLDISAYMKYVGIAILILAALSIIILKLNSRKRKEKDEGII